MGMSTVTAFKKAVRIAKYNHNHDELGRFAESGTGKKTSSKSRLYTNIDNYDGFSKETKQKVKRYINKKVKEVLPVDERLGDISKEDIISYVDKQLLEDDYSDSEKDMKLLKFTVDYLVHEPVEEAVKTYCREKTGVEDIDCHTLDSKLVLDFADGISWAKDKLGGCSKLSKLTKEWDPGYVAKTSITIDGEAHILLMQDNFEKGSDYFCSIDESSHWSPKNFSAKQVGAHEYAHAFEYEKTYEIYEKYGDNVRENAFNSHIVSESIVLRAVERMDKDLVSAAGEVSGYAKTNHGECFAECIADVFSNGENAAELSKEVFKIATEEIDDVCKKLDDDFCLYKEQRK